MRKQAKRFVKMMAAAVMTAAVATGTNFYGQGFVYTQAASDYFSMVENSITIMVGESDFIEVDLSADNPYTEQDLTWSSTDKSIVTVDEEGVITGVKEGTAAVTARMPDGSTDTCQITVSGYMNDEDDPDKNIDESEDGDPDDYSETPDFTGLSIPRKLTIYVKDTYFMDLTYEPQDADEETITWKSSNPNVATVNESGLVTGIKTGTVQIIAMTPNNITATCTVTVKKPQITLEKAKAKVKVGKRVQIKATCSPDTKPTFKSQDKSIATVTANGLVKAKKKGKTVIVVKANGVSKKFTVTVVR